MSGPGDGARGDNSDNPGGAGYSERSNDQGGSHSTLYDQNSNDHISWDTDRGGNYISGTGHQNRDGGKVADWD